MHNLIEYSKNDSKTSGSLWNYYKDILTDPITSSESLNIRQVLQGKQKMMEIQKKLNFLFH